MSSALPTGTTVAMATPTDVLAKTEVESPLQTSATGHAEPSPAGVGETIPSQRPRSSENRTDVYDGGSERHAFRSNDQPLDSHLSIDVKPETGLAKPNTETTAGVDDFSELPGPPDIAANFVGRDEFDDFAGPVAQSGELPGFDDFDGFAAAPSSAAAAAAQVNDFDDFAAPPPAVSGPTSDAKGDNSAGNSSAPGASLLSAGSAIAPVDMDSAPSSLQQDVIKMLSRLFPESEPPFSPLPPMDEQLDTSDLSEDEQEEAAWFGSTRSYVIWHRLALEGVFVDKMGELIKRFHWKTSFIRRQMLASLRSEWQDQKVFISDDDDNKKAAERASNGDLSAIVNLAVSRKQTAFDSGRAWAMCKIPEVELGGLSAAELHLFSVEMSLAAQQAATHLDQWLDNLEQANMDKETRNKMISVLVTTAQKKAAQMAAKQTSEKLGSRKPRPSTGRCRSPGASQSDLRAYLGTHGG